MKRCWFTLLLVVAGAGCGCSTLTNVSGRYPNPYYENYIDHAAANIGLDLMIGVYDDYAPVDCSY